MRRGLWFSIGAITATAVELGGEIVGWWLHRRQLM